MDIILRLDLPYEVRVDERSTLQTDADVSQHLIRFLVIKRFPQEIPREVGQVWAVLSNKIAAAVRVRTSTIVITSTELDFLIELANKTLVPPVLSSWLWTMLDHLESLRDIHTKETLH